MRKWQRGHVETVFKHPLFELQDRQLHADEDRRRAIVLETPDWVNVVARFTDGRLLLIRQWRYGIEQTTLEIPGGVVERGEEALEAARRELLEETGYRASRWSLLGAVHPNPAIQSNRCVTYLATDLQQIHELPPGDGEEELEVVTVTLEEIRRLISSGQITHSLVIAAMYLLGLAPGDPT